MALWKPFKGNRSALDAYEKHDGYVYFCIDDGTLHFDYLDDEGNLQRKQINAKDAETLGWHIPDEFLLKDEMPLQKSFATNAFEQKANEGEENTALGNSSIALGRCSVAGQKAYHIKNINWETCQIILYSGDEADYVKPFISTGDALSVYNPTFTSGFEIGDYFNIIQPEDHLYRQRYITAIDCDLITFNARFGEANEFSQDTVDRAVSQGLVNTDDFTFFVGDKPTVGAFVLSSTSLAQGYQAYAGGSYAHAEGVLTQALGAYSHAEGNTTYAGYSAHSEGSGTEAVGKYAHAEGFHTIADGNESHAEGHTTVARGDDAHAEGKTTTASGASSHAEGSGTQALSPHTHAEGEATIAGFSPDKDEGVTVPPSEEQDGKWAHAEGAVTYAFGRASHAEGNVTRAEGFAAHAEGNVTNAQGWYSHAEGSETLANAETSHAEGYNSSAYGVQSHAEGHKTMTVGTAAHSEGWETKAYGEASHTEGIGSSTRRTDGENIYDGKYAHAEGSWTTASGYASHTEGDATSASGNSAHAEGSGSIAQGDYSHAEGYATEVGGTCGHAEGQNTVVTAQAAHAEGIWTRAEGQGSHAEGDGSLASGTNAHAEGGAVEAIGKNSHAEGQVTHANGTASHAEGQGNTATGAFSHVGGSWSEANGENSFVHGLSCSTRSNNSVAFGVGVTTSENAPNQFALGKYNEVIDKSLFTVGNGTSNTARSNAFAVVNNTNNVAIKIGNTFITETQLNKLLKLICLNETTYMMKVTCTHSFFDGLSSTVSLITMKDDGGIYRSNSTVLIARYEGQGSYNKANAYVLAKYDSNTGSYVYEYEVVESMPGDPINSPAWVDGDIIPASTTDTAIELIERGSIAKQVTVRCYEGVQNSTLKTTGTVIIYVDNDGKEYWSENTIDIYEYLGGGQEVIGKGYVLASYDAITGSYNCRYFITESAMGNSGSIYDPWEVGTIITLPRAEVTVEDVQS